MEFNINSIRQLPLSIRRKMVDYIEGLPSDIKTFIRIHMNESYLLPELTNGKVIEIHPQCTLQRYLGKSRFCTDPESSFIQSEHCKICEKIDSESKTPLPVRNILHKIMMMQCYDLDSLIKMELEIANSLSLIRENPAISDWYTSTGRYITRTIIPYKMKCFDLCTYLTMNAELGLRESDYRYMQNLSGMIATACDTYHKSDASITDTALLIYIYMRELGLENVIDKYNLFDRFRCALDYCYKDESIDNVSDDVYSKLIEVVSTQPNMVAVINSLYSSGKLGKSVNDTDMEIPVMLDSSDMKEDSGIIVTMKNIRLETDIDFDTLAAQVRYLSKNEICHYVDIPAYRLSSDLNENDIGHMRNFEGIKVGTVYDVFTKELTHIALKNGQVFVLFKDMLRTSHVYGISIECGKIGEADTRQILTFEESKSILFKFISKI